MHIALSADVYEAVRSIQQHFPDAPVFLVGFSIAAYTMTKYLGEADSGVWPDDGKVQGGVLIGSGYDYSAEIAKISRPAILRILNFHFINCSWWSGYCKRYKEQLSKDPYIDLKAVKKGSHTSDAEAALFCPVTLLHLLCCFLMLLLYCCVFALLETGVCVPDTNQVPSSVLYFLLLAGAASPLSLTLITINTTLFVLRLGATQTFRPIMMISMA